MGQAKLLGAQSPLHALRRQLRMVRRQLTVLMPHNDYYVQAECAAALRQLGHRVVQVRLGTQGSSHDVSKSLGLLLRACAEHRPDMLLTINYTGFDRAAWFDELVEAMGLPVAVWFVDSPFFLAMGYLPPAPHVTSLFCWDASYVPVLRQLGAPHVAHLPLATDANVFTPAPALASTAQVPLGFVGHTLDTLVDHWRGQDVGEGATAAAEILAARLLGARDQLHPAMGRVGPPLDANVVRLAHANYLGSRTLRRTLLAALPQPQLHVFGNAAWRTLLPRAHAHPSCAYGQQTAELYRRCAINLNITNLQMPTGVNQRLFDVPAAGGFLLTDAQAEVERYFVPDAEVVTFADAAALRDKADYFARTPAARARVIAAARRRVLAEHTYVHRMQTLVATMRQQHGPAASRGRAANSPHSRPHPAPQGNPE